MYLRKAGMAEQAAGNAEAAKALYEQISEQYPASMEARDADKLMGTIR
jgi:TolA-binding protein